MGKIYESRMGEKAAEDTVAVPREPTTYTRGQIESNIASLKGRLEANERERADLADQLARWQSIAAELPQRAEEAPVAAEEVAS